MIMLTYEGPDQGEYITVPVICHGKLKLCAIFDASIFCRIPCISSE